MPPAFSRATRHKPRTKIHKFTLKCKKLVVFLHLPPKTSPPQCDVTPRRGNFSSTCADSSSHCTPHGTEMVREAPTSNEKESDLAEQRAASTEGCPHQIESHAGRQKGGKEVAEKGTDLETTGRRQQTQHPLQGGIFFAFSFGHDLMLIAFLPVSRGDAPRSFSTHR